MSKYPVILCVGRMYCDVIFTDLPRMPTAGTEVFAGGLSVHAGGGSAITAGHLAALGLATSLIAYLPSAGFGSEALHELEMLGVDMTLCRNQTAGTAPQLTVAMVQNGDRSFVTHRAGPAFPKFRAEDVRHLSPTHLHVGEAATLVDHPELIDIAKSLGASLSLDCSWDDNLDATAMTRLLPEVDVFLPNEAEVQLLRELGVSEPFSKITVIKQGPDGATAVMDGTRLHAPAVPVEAVDTTGAGDAFNAAFLSVWLAGESIETGLEFGNLKGAETVGNRGGLGGLAVEDNQPLRMSGD